MSPETYDNVTKTIIKKQTSDKANEEVIAKQVNCSTYNVLGSARCRNINGGRGAKTPLLFNTTLNKLIWDFRYTRFAKFFGISSVFITFVLFFPRFISCCLQ